MCDFEVLALYVRILLLLLLQKRGNDCDCRTFFDSFYAIYLKHNIGKLTM